jgi:hypothetical protein
MTSAEALAAIELIDACGQALVGLRGLFKQEGDDRTRDDQVQKLLAAVQDNLRILEKNKVLRNSNKVDDLRQLTKALAQDDETGIARTGSGNLRANQGEIHATYVMGGSGNQINSPGVYNEGPSGT